jgi:hypothetical protein
MAVLVLIGVLLSKETPYGLLTWQAIPEGIAARLAGIIITVLRSGPIVVPSSYYSVKGGPLV